MFPSRLVAHRKTAGPPWESGLKYATELRDREDRMTFPSLTHDRVSGLTVTKIPVNHSYDCAFLYTFEDTL